MAKTKTKGAARSFTCTAVDDLSEHLSLSLFLSLSLCMCVLSSQQALAYQRAMAHSTPLAMLDSMLDTLARQEGNQEQSFDPESSPYVPSFVSPQWGATLLTVGGYQCF